MGFIKNIINGIHDEKQRELESLKTDIALEELIREQRKSEELTAAKEATRSARLDISYEEFDEIVSLAERALKEKRLRDVWTDGYAVLGTIDSRSGYSDWLFEIGFYGIGANDYWIDSDVEDAKIPQRLAWIITEMIRRRY